MAPIDKLAELLAEPVAAARARRRAAYDAAAGGRPAVVLGTGAFGRKLAAALAAGGTTVLAFCDNNPATHGTAVDGRPVLAPADAAGRHGAEAAFVVGVLNPRAAPAEAVEQLRGLGCTTVVDAPLVAWRHPEAVLPSFFLGLPEGVLEAAPQVLAAYHLLGDDHSRREYVAQVRWHLRADRPQGPPVTDHPQYFPPDLFRPHPAEVFFDVGAFDGDTLRVLLDRGLGGYEAVVAFEPDPANADKLDALIAAQPPAVRAKLGSRRTATGAAPGVVRFAATGLSSAAIDPAGGLEVTVERLDAVPGPPPTYIKMDIEGAEPEAVAGAAGAVRRHRPVLAVCVYHAQSHLWELPLAVAALAPDYRFALRRYAHRWFETVCYAVPAERCPA